MNTLEQTICFLLCTICFDGAIQCRAEEPEHQVLYRAGQNGKWGYIDDKANWVVKPTHQDVGTLSRGLSLSVKEFGRWGLMNRSGEWICPPKFDLILPFQNTLVYAFRQEGKWGMITETGQPILPALADDISAWGPDLFFVLSNNKIGLRTISGEWRRPLEVEWPKEAGFPWPRGEIAWFDFDVGVNDRGGGYFTKSGRIPFKPKFGGASTHAVGGRLWLYNVENGEWSLTTTEGKILKKLKVPRIDWWFSFKGEPYWGVSGRLDTRDGEENYIGLLGPLGEYIIPPKNQLIWITEPGVLCCSGPDGTIFVDLQAPPLKAHEKFGSCKPHSEGLTSCTILDSVNQGMNTALVDTRGNIRARLPSDYSVSPFRSGMASFYSGSFKTWGTSTERARCASLANMK